MKPASVRPVDELLWQPAPRAGVLLPLPLSGAYDYKLPKGTLVSRGLLVSAPIGPREQLGVVWGKAEGTVGDNRLKEAVPLEGSPALPEKLCDLVDWVAQYTLTPPGMVLAMTLRSARAFEPEVTRTAYVLGSKTPERLTDARQRVLDVAADGLARSVPNLSEQAGVSPAVVRGLIDRDALVRVELPEFERFEVPDPAFATITLSEKQREAAQHIVDDVARARFAVSLLDGVTGSGKTEVYFEAVSEALRRGKQILILLPEIALTVQFLDRFAARFGCRPVEWHSSLSPAARRRAYRQVMNGEARVVVGARSALFLPFAKPGLIVVDEEHDHAYKQEDGVIYHARDMAVVRARFENCPIVLASATPSLESFVNARSGRYDWLRLTHRHGLAEMPEVRLIDMRTSICEPGQFLSPPLREALRAGLVAEEQSLVFLNRRGYAPLTVCTSCGRKETCRNCSAWLVEHRQRGRLVCHHCGHESAIPKTCAECGAENAVIACGPGVERVEEELRVLFPEARVAIASSDTLQDAAEAQRFIRAFSAGEIDILIGTQIVAK